MNSKLFGTEIQFCFVLLEKKSKNFERIKTLIVVLLKESETFELSWKFGTEIKIFSSQKIIFKISKIILLT